MRPFFPYYGSAWRKARRGFYPAPEHGLVVEPLAGAAGYSTAHAVERAVLCDVDESIAVRSAEILRLPDIDPAGSVDDVPGLCPEARLLIGWWLGRARARPARRPGAWFAQYPGSRFWSEGVRRRLAHQVERIRRWEVHHCDYRQAPRATATRFVDPPYKGRPGRRYRHGSADIDYDHLARECARWRGLTIVAERQGATWLPFWYAGDICATRGRASEAVCILRDGIVDRPQLALFGQIDAVAP